MAAAGGALRVAGQQPGDAGQRQHDADRCKGVGKSEHQRMLPAPGRKELERRAQAAATLFLKGCAR